MKLRVIEDPNPTLARTWADRVLWIIVLVVLLSSAAVALSAGTITVRPTAVTGTTAHLAIAPTEKYVECPFCHYVYAATVKDGNFTFRDHDYVRLVMTVDSYFETCVVTYFKHIGDAIQRMRELGSGRIVTVKPELKKEK